MTEPTPFRLSPIQRRTWAFDPAATVALTLELVTAPDAGVLVQRLREAVAAKDALGAELVRLSEFNLPRQRIESERRLLLAGQLGEPTGAAPAGAAWLRATLETERPSPTLTLEAPALFLDLPSLALLAREALGQAAPRPAPPLEQIAGWQETLAPGEAEADAAVAAWGSALAPPAWGFPLASRAALEQRPSHRRAVALSARARSGVDALVDSGVPLDGIVAGAVHGFARLLNWDRPWTSAHVLAGRPFEDLEPAVAALSAAVPLLLEADARTSFEAYAREACDALGRARAHELFAHLAEGSRERVSGQLVAAVAGGATVVATRSPLVESLLRFSLLGRPGAWRGQVEADATRLSEGSAAALTRTLTHLLERWLEDPAAPLADGVAGWSAGAPAARSTKPPARFLERVIAHAASTPKRRAVADETRALDFGTLERWSRGLAASIAAAGVTPGARVAIPARRRVETVVALLAALRAGTPYVPIDPAAPDAYARALIDAAACVAVLDPDDAALPASLPRVWIDEIDVSADTALAAPPADDAAAYVLFTSGSSGRPKGVVVSHRALDSLADGMWTAVHRHHEADRSVAINAPFTFDASLKQLCALAWGRALQIVPEACRTDPAAFTDHLTQHDVGCVDCTPSHLRGIVTAGMLGALPPLVLVGGEPVTPELWDDLVRAQATAFYNVYGLTEAADVSTATRIEGVGSTPVLGAALPGLDVRVVAHDGGECPPGVPGELHVGGPSVADGYLDSGTSGADAEQRFYERDGVRVLRTGDLVRRLADDALEYLGRIDRQVKLRGVRVEPAEVERALRDHPGVEDAVADLVTLADGRAALTAVAVPARRGSLALLGERTIDLGDGLVVAHLNRHETEYLREELLGGPGYLRNGLQLERGDVVLDVGANIGLAGLAFHRAVPGLRVLGFEPIPQLAALANANFRAHGVDGVVHTVGLGPADEDAELSFYPGYSIMSSRYADPAAEEQTVRRFIANQVADGSGDAALLEHLDAYLAGRFAPELVACRFQRLSSVLRDLGVERVALLKIDAQKSERGVLAGIDPSDFARIDQITMELHDFDDNIAAVRELLSARGFAHQLAQDSELVGTDRWHLTATRAAKPRARETTTPSTSAESPVVSAASLRAHLAERLPETLRPGLVVLAEGIPRTANGKFDAAAVAALAREQRAAVGDTEPRTPAEAVLAALFRRWLGLSVVALDDNFYEIGGDSILQIQIAADAVSQGLSLLPKDFVAEPTVRSLARVATERADSVAATAPAAPGSAAVELTAAERERLTRELALGHDPW